MKDLSCSVSLEGELTGFEPATPGSQRRFERKMVPPEDVDLRGLRFSNQHFTVKPNALSVLLDTSQQSSKQPQKQPHMTSGFPGRRSTETAITKESISNPRVFFIVGNAIIPRRLSSETVKWTPEAPINNLSMLGLVLLMARFLLV